MAIIALRFQVFGFGPCFSLLRHQTRASGVTVDRTGVQLDVGRYEIELHWRF